MTSDARMEIGQHVKITVGPCTGQEAYIVGIAPGNYQLSDSLPSGHERVGGIGSSGLWVLRQYVESIKKAQGEEGEPEVDMSLK